MDADDPHFGTAERFEDGDRVLIIGTKHRGFRGTVTNALANGVMVLLDEWDEPLKFYSHNLKLLE